MTSSRQHAYLIKTPLLSTTGAFNALKHTILCVVVVRSVNLEKKIRRLDLLPVFMHFYSRVNHSVYNICRGYLFSYQTVLLILIGALVSNVEKNVRQYANVSINSVQDRSM